MLEKSISIVILIFMIIGIYINIYYINESSITGIVVLFNIITVFNLYIMGTISNFSYRKLPQIFVVIRFLHLIIVALSTEKNWSEFMVYIGIDLTFYILLIVSDKTTVIIDKEVDDN